MVKFTLKDWYDEKVIVKRKDPGKYEAKIRIHYEDAKKDYPEFSFTDLDAIFEVAMFDMGLFPAVLADKKKAYLYLERWVGGYVDAVRNPPHSRMAKPKSACTDPAVRIIVQANQSWGPEEATRGELTHNLFMSAENIQGSLLEEYIAAETREYGIVWCAGHVLQAVDFCNTSGTLLLQVKNKSNTENSSSSKIRAGTPIQKWYRLGTRRRNGRPIPDYRWSNLNALINDNKTRGYDLPPCGMSEEGYLKFLRDCAQKNPRMVTDQ